jgi:CheY-like chemotaxis protein
VKKVTAVATLIQEAVQFALSGGNVACRFAFDDHLWLCDIDKNQIGQVVDNIVINAQHAMPNGGAIDVSAVNLRLGDKENPALPAGTYVRLSFRDYGIGISKDLMPRIFDPFYTTKPKGHGLGLATCYSIVHRHGGCIDVESEPGKGSTFHVYLPAVTGSIAEQVKPSVKRRGAGTIIVVDDEEVIRRTVSKMLQLLGYQAVCKSDGRELVEFYAAELALGHRYVGIILDLTIRDGMGGVETAAAIRRVDPRVPIFVASGYADDAAMQSPAEFGFNASLCKPFTVAELSELLEQHLKSASPELATP